MKAVVHMVMKFIRFAVMLIEALGVYLGRPDADVIIVHFLK